MLYLYLYTPGPQVLSYAGACLVFQPSPAVCRHSMKQWISDSVFVWIFDREGNAPMVTVDCPELGKQTIFGPPFPVPSPFRGEQSGAAGFK